MHHMNTQGLGRLSFTSQVCSSRHTSDPKFRHTRIITIIFVGLCDCPLRVNTHLWTVYGVHDYNTLNSQDWGKLWYLHLWWRQLLMACVFYDSLSGYSDCIEILVTSYMKLVYNTEQHLHLRSQKVLRSHQNQVQVQCRWLMILHVKTGLLTFLG